MNYSFMCSGVCVLVSEVHFVVYEMQFIIHKL